MEKLKPILIFIAAFSTGGVTGMYLLPDESRSSVLPSQASAVRAKFELYSISQPDGTESFTTDRSSL